MATGALMIRAGRWVLVLAGLMLLAAALRLGARALALGLAPSNVAWLAPAAVLLGLFKARRLMGPRLAENAAWLRGRDRVPAWRVFPPRLLLLIACMVAGMAGLKALARGRPLPLAVLGSLDLAVGVALLRAAVGVGRPEGDPRL